MGKFKNSAAVPAVSLPSDKVDGRNALARCSFGQLVFLPWDAAIWRVRKPTRATAAKDDPKTGPGGEAPAVW
jgi:hypothetical protein